MSKCVIRIHGGLGNQMFQYAFARNLSIRNNTTVKLDVITGEWSPSRKYTLDKFNIEENYTTIEENKIWKTRLFKESCFRYMPSYLTLQNRYIIGYFQTEKYFKDVEDVIRQDFILKDGYKTYDSNDINDMINTNSVCVGFRRGDYTREDLSNFHGLMNISYYKKALKDLTERIGTKDIKLFVYSDDIEWVKNNFNSDYETKFVSKPLSFHSDANIINNTDYEDLMSTKFCKYFIIPNSSFFWWGSWLSSYSDKIIYAPTSWFLDKKLNNESNDIVPESWIKL